MRTIGILTLLLAGCGSEPPCELRDGAYQLDTRELSGDCGELGSGLQTPDDAKSGCTTVPLPHVQDTCSESFRRLCRAPDGSGQTVEIVAAYTRQDDDETWTGRVDATLRDSAGRIVCHSLYEAVITPQ